MTRLQAEAIAKALAATVEPLATKQDLKAAEGRLEQEIQALRKQDLKATEDRLGNGIESLRKDMKAADDRLGKDIESLRKDMKAAEDRLGKDIESLRKETKAAEDRLGKDIESLRKETKAGFASVLQQTDTKIESVKVWLLGGLLAIALSIVVFALQVAAEPVAEREFETGQPIRQPPETTQSAISNQTNL